MYSYERWHGLSYIWKQQWSQFQNINICNCDIEQKISIGTKIYFYCDG